MLLDVSRSCRVDIHNAIEPDKSCHYLVMQIGFNAPQGCGKTTLVFALDYLFRITGR